MNKISLFACLLTLISMQARSQSTIAEARAFPLGTTVTVRGVVTNGSELGIIRYLQDATAGIAAYGGTVESIERGDSIEITGVLKNYNYLLELDPVNSFVVLDQNKPLPVPQIVTPSQMSESYEAELVRIDNAVFSNGGSLFSGNTNYNITANGQTAQVRININSPLVGEVIPSGPVSLIGICSQFSYSSSTSGYQLLLRDEDDIITPGTINIISPIDVSGITTSGFDLEWTTDIAGTTELFYGLTPSLELGHLTTPGTGTSHQVSITGRNPSDLVFVKAFSVAGNDTGFSQVRPFITTSASTGVVKIYFTSTVDPSVSSGTDAIYINDALDDTVIAYINRAKYTIDVAIYNFNIENISSIASALNAAFNRGVTVRVVTDGNTGNSGIPELVAGIKKIARQTSEGIMHDKFMIIDGNSGNPNDPVVWTGSCNWTSGNINTDANNNLFIQDQSLARIYILEFEEMFGSSTATPDPSKARFGSDKTDNTPHEVIIGGKRVEVYFSPSDGVNGRIIEKINSADLDLMVNTMLITRTDIGDAISAKAQEGISAKVIVNSRNDCGETVVTTLISALGTNFKEFNENGILHNKLMIVDQGDSSSDPVVLTGSHNWSSSADQKNDENTLVIHDAGIANIYYQEFSQRFKNGVSISNNPVLNLGVDREICSNLSVTLDAGQFTTYLWSTGETTATIVVDSSGIGAGTKVIWCEVTDNNGVQSDTVRITFLDCSAVGDSQEELSGIRILPNPNKGSFSVEIGSVHPVKASLNITDVNGRIVSSEKILLNRGMNTIPIVMHGTASGIYFLSVETGGDASSARVIIQ